jgi:hypothetical protein
MRHRLPDTCNKHMTGHLIEPAIKALIDTRNFDALHKIWEESIA